MFSISLQSLTRDILAIAVCIGITGLASFVYLAFCLRFARRRGEPVAFSDLIKRELAKPILRLGAPAFFCFLGAYGCKLVLLKIFFALAYAFVMIKIFIREKPAA